MYKSADLVTWEGPKVVFTVPENGWADPSVGVSSPEMVNYRGKFLLFATFENSAKAIDEPPAAFEGPLDMMSKTLAHEQMVTRSINDLMDIAISEKDHATRIFLQWYVTEQVEEEENDNDIIDQLKLIKDNPQGLMMLDRELAQRAATVPLDFSKGVSASEG